MHRPHRDLTHTRNVFVPVKPRISVVDDDESVREAIQGLLDSSGFMAEVFSSAEELLRSGRLVGTACLVLDVSLPGISGIELHDRLIAAGDVVPIVFVTAHADDLQTARALGRGTIDCLEKPFTDDALLGAISRAISGAPSA